MVAKIGRHDIFTIKDTQMIRLFDFTYEYDDPIEDEKKYVNIFKDFTLDKCFYFSYTYNLTIKMQDMIMKKLKASDKNKGHKRKFSNYKKSFSAMRKTYDFTSFQKKFSNNTSKTSEEEETFQAETYFPWNENFMWNYWLIHEFFSIINDKRWVMPVIHGYINCSNLDIKSKMCNIILIARRSRHFAGTRYLKRGLNEEGRVANFVEVEQIVYSQMSKDDKPLVSSFVQVRGSVPLFWSQDPSPLIAKPEIVLSTSDVDYKATKRHIADLFQRYSLPLIIFNLTKETDAREAMLSDEYKHVIG